MQTHAELRERTQEVLEFLKSEGMRLHPMSRFQQYLKQFDAMSRADGVIVPTGFDLRTWHRSLLELSDLHLIVNELCRPPEVMGWRKAFQQIVSGEPIPIDEVKHSRSRDIQFELVTAAMLRAAGYEIELAEPDVVVKVQKRKYGVAAKRPRSFGNLDKVVKDADAQIGRSGHDGFIALDLSSLLNPLDRPITASVFDSALHSTIKATDAFLTRNATLFVIWLIINTLSVSWLISAFSSSKRSRNGSALRVAGV
jgi:hypothetical protein